MKPREERIIIFRSKQPRRTLMGNRLVRGSPGGKEPPSAESEAKRELAQRQQLGRRKEEGGEGGGGRFS